VTEGERDGSEQITLMMLSSEVWFCFTFTWRKGGDKRAGPFVIVKYYKNNIFNGSANSPSRIFFYLEFEQFVPTILPT